MAFFRGTRRQCFAPSVRHWRRWVLCSVLAVAVIWAVFHPSLGDPADPADPPGGTGEKPPADPAGGTGEKPPADLPRPTVTPWGLDIVWEGTFDPALVDAIQKPRNIKVAVTVFALGNYVDFLKDFLESAEKHFFLGFQVLYFVFTDRPSQVPSMNLPAGRQLVIRPTASGKRWQDISAHRHTMIAHLIETELRGRVDYLFCLDVDSKFHGRWGTETLGQLVAVLHPGYYLATRSEFPYERRPESKAFMSADDGDFYYAGAAYGGELPFVHHMMSTCSDNFEWDKRQGIEAIWQEESHLNNYLWFHKPSTVLSPEYQWQDVRPRRPEVKVIRFSGIIKDYAKIRPGWGKADTGDLGV